MGRVMFCVAQELLSFMDPILRILQAENMVLTDLLAWFSFIEIKIHIGHKNRILCCEE